MPLRGLGGNMTFTGKGVVWNPKKGAPLVNFKYTETYETEDKQEIDLLSQALGVHPVFDKPEEAPKKVTKADLVAEAKERGITGAERLSKAALQEKLEE